MGQLEREREPPRDPLVAALVFRSACAIVNKQTGGSEGDRSSLGLSLRTRGDENGVFRLIHSTSERAKFKLMIDRLARV